jgi:hypothetical protein
VRKLLKDEGLSDIEKELSNLNSKYSSAKRGSNKEHVAEYSNMETFGQHE